VRAILSFNDILKVTTVANPKDQSVSIDLVISGNIKVDLFFTESFWEKTKQEKSSEIVTDKIFLHKIMPQFNNSR
jgi:hypothetical protein